MAILLFHGLAIPGGFMSEHDDVRQVIRLFKDGEMKLGKENAYKISGTFSMEE